MVRALSEKVRIMDREFEFLKEKLEQSEGRAKSLAGQKEALETQLKELKE